MIVTMNRRQSQNLLARLTAPRVGGQPLLPRATVRVRAWTGETFLLRVLRLEEIKGRQGVVGRALDPETGRQAKTRTWCYLDQVVEITKAAR